MRTSLPGFILPLLSGALLVGGTLTAVRAEVPVTSEPIAAASFDGEKTAWHDGFDRFDYVLDEATLAITPFHRDADERFGVKAPAPGQRRCIVVVPKKAAPGNPWSWQGCYWDHQPQAEVELLRRGFHIAFITPDPDATWDAFYTWLTTLHGLSKKPAFVGMSKGAFNAFTWATAHPDKVSAIYGDNPGSSPELLMKMGELVKADVPLLNISGSIDPLLGRFSLPTESIFQQLGGRYSMMIKEGTGHHPHSLHDPTPIADFITRSVQEIPPAKPDYIGEKSSRTSFYSNRSTFRRWEREGLDITTRGPAFAPSYVRYQFEPPGVSGAITLIEPTHPAEGNPWVFRADFVPRDAAVDLALLERGFRIVTGPIPYNADGPQREAWDAVYEHLVAHGFSKTPILGGAGAAAGDACAWALAHPDRVACLYGENPVLHSIMSNTPSVQNLAPLAAAGIPILYVCGSLDPHLADTSRTIEKQYREFGGKITILVEEGRGHFPLSPSDPAPVLELLLAIAHR